MASVQPRSDYRSRTAGSESPILIGDNPETDIVGGNAVGMTTVWYRPSGSVAIQSLAAKPDFIVRDYAEVLEALATGRSGRGLS